MQRTIRGQQGISPKEKARIGTPAAGSGERERRCQCECECIHEIGRIDGTGVVVVVGSSSSRQSDQSTNIDVVRISFDASPTLPSSPSAASILWVVPGPINDNAGRRRRFDLFQQQQQPATATATATMAPPALLLRASPRSPSAWQLPSPQPFAASSRRCAAEENTIPSFRKPSTICRNTMDTSRGPGGPLLTRSTIRRTRWLPFRPARRPSRPGSFSRTTTRTRTTPICGSRSTRFRFLPSPMPRRENHASAGDAADQSHLRSTTRKRRAGD
mmetsp:Transcript_7890/g.23233  ORF Transcript_7890/g.23233 Transcript_7890/m.23233 type:complete len:273 (+) Transcript_7890:309-1127(+)